MVNKVIGVDSIIFGGPEGIGSGVKDQDSEGQVWSGPAAVMARKAVKAVKLKLRLLKLRQSF